MNQGKCCQHCRVVKPLEDFCTAPRKRDGRHFECKDCHRERQRRRRGGIHEVKMRVPDDLREKISVEIEGQNCGEWLERVVRLYFKGQ